MSESDNNNSHKGSLPPMKPTFLGKSDSGVNPEHKQAPVPKSSIDEVMKDNGNDDIPPIPKDANVPHKQQLPPIPLVSPKPEIKKETISHKPETNHPISNEIKRIVPEGDKSQVYPKISRKELEKEVIRSNTLGAKRWFLFTMFFFMVSFVMLAYAFYLKDRVDYTYNYTFKEIKALKESNKTYKGKADYYNSTISSLNKENNDIKANMETLKLQINNNNLEITTYKKQIDALGLDVSTYKQQVNALDKEVAVYKRQVNALGKVAVKQFPSATKSKSR